MRNNAIVIMALAVLVLTGCVTSRQARTVTPGGFLGTTASLLQKGERGEEALLVYHREGTDWRSYDKIILEPVSIWHARVPALPANEITDYQKLVDSFHGTLTEKLSRTYGMVNEPEAGTLRIEIAIINGAQANSTMKFAKTFAPYAGFADALWTFITGKPAFTGEVSLEYIIRDSVSGEVLSAGADRRVGGNQLGAATFTTWGDVRNILTYWSDLAVYRLCVDRAAADCRRPDAGLTDP